MYKERRILPETNLETAVDLRSRILPHGKVALRKTFGLNEPGCAVNCTYCTLGEQYIGTSNMGRLRDGLEEDVSQQLFTLPPDTHFELVGYWAGINRTETEIFTRLRNLVQSMAQKGVIGADLGIVLNPQVFIELREAGLTYFHNNLETVPRLYPTAIGKPTNRLRAKLETLELAYNCGLKVTSGILIGLGENSRDLQELLQMLNSLPLARTVVNFMDYDTDQRIGQYFMDLKEQLSPDYAFQALSFLRLGLNRNQSLMVGSGVGRYLYGDLLPATLKIVDTLHIGAFINLERSGNQQPLINCLNELNYEIVPVPIS